MAPFLAQMLQWGLRLVGNAALVKGKGFIKEKTGVDLDKGALTEQDRLKLAQFEKEHEEELLRLQLEDNKLGLEETKAYLADVADARRAQSEIQVSPNAPWYTKAVQPALAVVTVLLTFTLFFFFVFWSGTNGGITPEQKDLIVYILGVLSAVVTQIFSFYFGSSKGSESKNDMLTQVLNRTVDGSAAKQEVK